MVNLNLKKTAIVGMVSLLGCVSVAQAQKQESIAGTTPFGSETQYRTWSIGINAGLLNQSNIFGFNRDGFDKLEHNVGYSAYIKKQLSPSFGLKAQYMGGKVAGKNEDAAGTDIAAFETKMPWSAALSGEWTFGNSSWRFFNGLVKPYLALGIGALNFETTIKDVEDTKTKNDASTKLYVPADFGFKFAVARGINIDLGYQLNWANQKFDGQTAGSQYKNDLFSYAHAGLEIALGSSSKPALNNSNPVATLVNDYTVKYDDLKAQNEALSTQLATLNDELKDDDGDGVANKFDKCPNTPAGVKVDGSGCPLPELKNETKVIEKIMVTEEDKKVVAEAINNLEFDLGKSTIRSTSFPSLNNVAALLIEKNFSLKLAGHTDNTGSMQTNMRLSKERAEAVKSYLVSKGANASRIEATGYGPTQPIATNANAAGRQQNRRVEFTLY